LGFVVKHQGEDDVSTGIVNVCPIHIPPQGTPTYIAPEVVSGNSYGLKADVWSLGVVFYEMFNGALLEQSKDKHALAHLEQVPII